ncbi:Hypothetical protein CINCED_3A020465 [Cinara cedri]|uniref:Uncharacterized protein n=1 Tax=Cinara cedri TaxID=506608 RepID=A0A5E4NFI6_9HEMI|nr:Hypothetical protein CINCED_3A020465 [Cinara cedri]
MDLLRNLLRNTVGKNTETEEMLTVNCKELAMEIHDIIEQKNNLVLQLKEQLNEKCNIITEYDELRKKLKCEIDSAYKKYEEIKLTNKNTDDKCINVTKDKEILQRKILCMEKILAKKDVEIAQTKLDNTELTREIIKLQSETKSMKYTCDELSEKLKDRNEKLVEQTKINDERNYVIKELETKAKCQEELSKIKIFNIECESNRREDELREKYNECGELKDQLKVLNITYADLLSQFTDLNDKLKIKTNENVNLACKIEQNTCVINDLKCRVTCEEDSLKTKDSEILQLKREYTQHENEMRENYESQYNELHSKLKDLNEKHSRLCVQFTDLKEEMEKKDDENRNLATQIDERNKKIINNESAIKCLENKFTVAEEALKSKDSEIVRMRREHTQRMNESDKRYEHQYREFQRESKDIKNKTDNEKSLCNVLNAGSKMKNNGTGNPAVKLDEVNRGRAGKKAVRGLSSKLLRDMGFELDKKVFGSCTPSGSSGSMMDFNFEAKICTASRMYERRYK